MKFYVSTSDKYLHLIKPFSFLFNKFWSDEQEVVVLGYKTPNFKLPNNFSFVSMGKSINNPSEWSNGLIDYFSNIEDEWFMYATEDMFLVNPVDFKSLKKLKGYTKDKSTGRIGLTNDIHIKTCFNITDNVVEMTQDSQYRISCITSIWNKEYMLKTLKRDMTPWEFEVNGTSASCNDGYRILGLNSDFPVRICLAIRRGNFDSLDFKFDNEDRSLDGRIVDEMRGMGII
jgi:hypothetical protein